ncbi:stalk domain-containing protein [Paenibacillus nicotianae]|uniref:Stalk domain-containing protein n=1 Tax=Paenibacillus nicotianae TaxID=1526551 RepID=A0ABW4UQH0_9BACL
MKVSKYVIPLVVCLCLGLCIPFHITSAKDNTTHALESISYIQTSLGTSYAIDKDGTIWTWGSGINAGTGDNFTHISPLPFTTPNAPFKTISPGAGIYTSAVTQQGLVYSWGVDDPSRQKTSSPVQVQGLKDIVASATGSEHFLALDKNGQVWGWGSNKAGQLDNTKVKTTSTYTTPTPLPGLNGVKAISTYDNYSVALKKDGTLWGWGSINESTTSPTLLTGGQNIVSVTMSYREVIAVNKEGQVLDWDLSSGMHAPKTYTLKLPITSTDNGAAGGIYAIATNGSVWKIDPRNQPTITQVNGLKQTIQIASGNSFTLALDQNGMVHSWGSNAVGQLGIGNPFNPSGTSTPVIVQKPITVQLNKTELRIPNLPFLKQNAVYVPVRGLFEKMNATVTWNKQNRNDVFITSGTTSIHLTKGKNTAIVNGKSVPLSSPPQYVNESIFIPLRFISETIGAHVNWDSTNYTVSIDTN